MPRVRCLLYFVLAAGTPHPTGTVLFRAGTGASCQDVTRSPQTIGQAVLCAGRQHHPAAGHRSRAGGSNKRHLALTYSAAQLADRNGIFVVLKPNGRWGRCSDEAEIALPPGIVRLLAWSDKLHYVITYDAARQGDRNKVSKDWKPHGRLPCAQLPCREHCDAGRRCHSVAWRCVISLGSRRPSAAACVERPLSSFPFCHACWRSESCPYSRVVRAAIDGCLRRYCDAATPLLALPS